MLFYDSREPKSITSRIEEVCAQSSIPCVKGRFPSGDFIFSYATQSSIRKVGIERKEVNDLISSLIEKRLDIQLSNLAEEYDDAFLVIEGALWFRKNKEGRLGVQAEGRGREIHANAVKRLLDTLKFRNIYPIYTEDKDDTVMRVAGLYMYCTTNLHKEPPLLSPHMRFGRKAMPKPVACLTVVEGMGEEKAKALVKKFGSISNMISASDKDLGSVPGIGPVLVSNFRKVFNE